MTDTNEKRPEEYTWGDWINCPRCDSHSVKLEFDIFDDAQIVIECKRCGLFTSAESEGFYHLFSDPPPSHRRARSRAHSFDPHLREADTELDTDADADPDA